MALFYEFNHGPDQLTKVLLNIEQVCAIETNMSGAVVKMADGNTYRLTNDYSGLIDAIQGMFTRPQID